MGIGAVPFVLAPMFEAGFGLDAVHARLRVLAVFAGKLVVIVGTTPALPAFGFRCEPLWKCLFYVATILASPPLAPATPAPVFAAVLFVGALTRSMRLGACNTFAFAGTGKPRLAAANTLHSILSYLATRFGVAPGALAMRLGHVALGRLLPGVLHASEFLLALVLFAMVGLAALIDVLRLVDDAGGRSAVN
jgi:hypothetical protein